MVQSAVTRMDNSQCSGSYFDPSVRPIHCIAVIDDEPLIREIARAALTHSGYGVVDAGDGKQGIELIARLGNEISAILLDITMPVMDGAAVLRWIRENGYTMPVVLCSGYSQIEVELQFKDLEYYGFLEKPFTAPRLVEAIRMAVQSKI